MHIDIDCLTHTQRCELRAIAEKMHYVNRESRTYGGGAVPPSAANSGCDVSKESGLANELLRNRNAGGTTDAADPTMQKIAAGVAERLHRSFAPPRTIGWAIKQLRNGSRVTRAGWNGRGQWLALQLPDGGSFMTLPYIYIRTVAGDRVPWLPSQTDILATDWQLT